MSKSLDFFWQHFRKLHVDILNEFLWSLNEYLQLESQKIQVINQQKENVIVFLFTYQGVSHTSAKTGKVKTIGVRHREPLQNCIEQRIN